MTLDPVKFEQTHLSVLVSLHRSDGLVGELYACLSVDIQAVSGTPSGEGIGIDVNFAEGLPLTPEIVDEVLGQIEPLFVRSGELMRVNK